MLTVVSPLYYTTPWHGTVTSTLGSFENHCSGADLWPVPPETKWRWQWRRSNSSCVVRPPWPPPERWKWVSRWHCSTFSGSTWWWCGTCVICWPPHTVASLPHMILTWREKRQMFAQLKDECRKYVRDGQLIEIVIWLELSATVTPDFSTKRVLQLPILSSTLITKTRDTKWCPHPCPVSTSLFHSIVMQCFYVKNVEATNEHHLHSTSCSSCSTFNPIVPSF